MIKRILAMILVLALTLSILPLALVSAETEEVKASPKAGTHTPAAHSDDCGVTEGWKEWGNPSKLPTEGKYILTTNVNVTAEAVLTGDLTLCLNGYVIKSNGTNRILGTKKDADTTLTITDCTAHVDEDGVYQAGVLTGGKKTADGGGALFVRRGGTLKIYDGRITGNTFQGSSTSVGGGAIMLQTASSGLIAKAFIYGGELTGNYSYKADGVTGNNGGAIFAGGSAELTIEGGTFSDNFAANGGVVYGATTTVNIKGATFTGNTATLSGSVVHNNGAMNLTIGEGTVITGNVGTYTDAEEGYSAAVSMCGSNGKLTLSGNVYIANNNVGAANVGSINFNKVASDTLYVNGLASGSYVEFSTSKATVTNPGDATDPVIAVSGAQSQWSNGWVVHLDTDGTARHIGKDDNGFKFVDGHFHENVEYTKLTSADQLIAGGKYYLDGNVTLTKAAIIPDGVETTICLNGQTLTSTYTAGATFQTKDNDAKATFNIYDCTAYTDAEGVYHAGTFSGIQNKSTGHGGIFMIRNSGTLNFYDGRFENCTAANAGGALFINGTANVHRAEFKNCKGLKDTTAKDGGAVYVNSQAKGTIENATFTGNSGRNGGALAIYGTATVKNCTFTGNTGTTGGAIYVKSTKAVTLDGCTVTGNTGNGTGELYVDAATTLTLKNKMVVGNVMMAYDAEKGASYLNVAGLTSGSNLAISLTDARIAAGEMVFSTASASNNKTYFTAEDYEVELNEENKLQLVKTQVTPPASTHIHTLCNDTGCTDHAGDVTYEAWTDANNLPTEGNWYLDTDVEVTAEVKLEVATELNLCLNGHTVTGVRGSNVRAYSTVSNVSSTINISDCKASGQFANFDNTSTGSGGGVIFIRPGSTLRVFDVTFHNNSSMLIGGAITNTGLTELYNCVFTENKVPTGKNGGGAIYNNSMAVSGTTYVGDLKAYDCAFTGNTAYNGAVVYSVSNADLEFEDCVFLNNVAENEGGALRISTSTTTLKNVTFTGNQAETGAALTVYGGVFTLEDGIITGNHASSGYGAMHLSRNNSGADQITVTLKGEVIVNDNTKGPDKVANNLFLREYEYYVDATGLTADSMIGVSVISGRITNGYTNITTGQNGVDNSKYFTSDDAEWIIKMGQEVYLAPAFEHIHCVCGKADCADTTHQKVSYLAWNDATALPASGNYCLQTDVTVSKEESVTKDLNLCLHGHTITGFTADGARAFSTVANTAVTISISDCTAKTENGVYTAGKFTGFNNTHNDSGGAAIYIRAGSTLNFFDGIVENCTAGSGGGALYAHTSTINMYGGLLTNNTAKLGDTMKNGAGVFLYMGTLNMYGGEISNNKAANGAGIHLFDSTSRLNISGGTITGNTATAEGAGINAAHNAVVVNISGNPVIMGNTTTSGKASNLRLGGTGKISVTDLADDAQIGVTASARRAISTETADYTEQFFSDDAKMVVLYQDNALYMASSSTHKHCLCVATSAVGCDHAAIEQFDEWDNPESLPTSGSYYLSVDVKITGAQTRLRTAP